MKNALITGATGTLGRKLVAALLEQTEAHLYLLARGRKRMSAEDRIRKLLADQGVEHLGDRVTTLVGDVGEPGFGLDHADLARLRGPIDRFFHVAATTDLGTTSPDAQRVNINGTANALRVAGDLRRDGRLGRYVHFSTAYVAGGLGDHLALEDDLPDHADFHANPYEASKCQAERLVRDAARDGLPTTILRPSIVVGDSRTGEISDFSGIYAILRLWAYGLMSRLPAVAANPVNIVPIDYVTQASLAISSRDDSQGKTYHLVASRPTTIGTLIEAAREERPSLPPIAFEGSNGDARREPHDGARSNPLHPLLVYLNCRLHFDVTNTTAALTGTGVEPPVTDYGFLRRLVRYAVMAGYLA